MNKKDLKKRRIHSYKSSPVFRKNEQKLSLLPTFFISLLFIIILLFVVWDLNIFDVRGQLSKNDQKTSMSPYDLVETDLDKKILIDSFDDKIEQNVVKENKDTNQKLPFDTVKALETKTVGDYVLYLSNGCDSDGKLACELWGVNRNEGGLKLIEKNVADTGDVGINELTKGCYLRFSKTQDYSGGVNFIFVDKVNKVFKVISYNPETRRIYQAREVEYGSEMYNLYF